MRTQAVSSDSSAGYADDVYFSQMNDRGFVDYPAPTVRYPTVVNDPNAGASGQLPNEDRYAMRQRRGDYV